jgi:hypothetical protein
MLHPHLAIPPHIPHPFPVAHIPPPPPLHPAAVAELDGRVYPVHLDQMDFQVANFQLANNVF